MLYANTTVYHHCVVGSRSVLHSGCVIGSDGFGFAPQADGSYKKIPQTGNVVLGTDVEVGANTCIDRAVIGSTKIGNGVKLDNLIQIAHNVELGDNTVDYAERHRAVIRQFGRFPHRNALLGRETTPEEAAFLAEGGFAG